MHDTRCSAVVLVEESRETDEVPARGFPNTVLLNPGLLGVNETLAASPRP